MLRTHLKKPRGSIALLSVLLIGAVLLGITITNFDGLFYEYEANRLRETKERSLALATGCMEHALQSLGRAATYQGNESYAIDGEPCTILPIETGGGWTLKTTATVQQQTSRLLVRLSSRAPITISSWQEDAAPVN